MSTTIRLDLDDGKVAAGFKRIAQSVKDSGATVAAATNGMYAPLNRYTSQMKTAESQVKKTTQASAEGLGFVTSSLALLDQRLVLVGEATVKQLPTLIKYGEVLKQWGLVGGTLSATAFAIGQIGNELGKLNKEAFEGADDTLQFIENWSRFASRFLDGPMTGKPLKALADWAQAKTIEAERDRAEIAKTEKLRISAMQEFARLDKLRQSAAMANYAAGTQASLKEIDSVTAINALLADQQDRIKKLADSKTEGGLTEERAEKEMALQQALFTRRSELEAQEEHKKEEAAAAQAERNRRIADSERALIIGPREQAAAIELDRLQTIGAVRAELLAAEAKHAEMLKRDSTTIERIEESERRIVALRGKETGILLQQQQIQRDTNIMMEAFEARRQREVAQQEAMQERVQGFLRKMGSAGRVGGGGPAGGQVGGQAAGRAGGWQQWGGPVKVPELQDFWGKAAVDLGVAGGRGDGKIDAKAKLFAKDALQRKLAEIDAAFNEQMAAVAGAQQNRGFFKDFIGPDGVVMRGEAMGPAMNRQEAALRQRELRRDRNLARRDAMREVGQDRAENAGQLQQEAADKRIDAMAKQAGATDKMMEFLRESLRADKAMSDRLDSFEQAVAPLLEAAREIQRHNDARRKAGKR